MVDKIYGIDALKVILNNIILKFYIVSIDGYILKA